MIQLCTVTAVDVREEVLSVKTQCVFDLVKSKNYFKKS